MGRRWTAGDFTRKTSVYRFIVLVLASATVASVAIMSVSRGPEVPKGKTSRGRVMMEGPEQGRTIFGGPGSKCAEDPGSAGCIDPTAVAAGVYGPVRKAGMTAMVNWHPSFANLRVAQFKTWMETKRSLLHGSSPDALSLVGVRPPTLLPFHAGRGCNVYYNARYKIIFLRTQKVASTTTMSFFGECASEPRRPTCLKPLNLEDSLQLQLTWRNYFVFGWSRNPWARAVSSYQYLLHAVRDEPQCDRVDWDTFCQDPLVFGELCREHPECCPHFNHNFMWFHVNDQTSCLTTDSGEWAADFIGRSERFDEDFPRLIAEINRRRPKGVPPLSATPLPQSQNANEEQCRDAEEQQPGAGEQEAEGAGASGGEPGEGEGLAGGRRRLLYGKLPGFLFDQENYCDKRKYYSGRHEACFRQVARFYGNDLRKLGFIATRQRPRPPGQQGGKAPAQA